MSGYLGKSASYTTGQWKGIFDWQRGRTVSLVDLIHTHKAWLGRNWDETCAKFALDPGCLAVHGGLEEYSRATCHVMLLQDVIRIYFKTYYCASCHCC